MEQNQNQYGINVQEGNSSPCAGDEVLDRSERILAAMCELVDFSTAKLTKIATPSDPQATPSLVLTAELPPYFQALRLNLCGVMSKMNELRDLIERVEV